MKPKDVREKTSDELKKQLSELEEDLFRLRFKHSIGQLEQTANIRKTKRNIARISTIIRERVTDDEGKKK